MGILSKSPTMKQDHGTSMPQNTATGGGSRPTKGTVMTEVSAPTDAHTLERAPPGWLK